MDLNEYLHKFVNDHTEKFLQNFYSLVESSQIECQECPIEKTSTDNFLLKIYINNMLHSIRTLILTCVCGSVGNLLHNTIIENPQNDVYLIDSECNIILKKTKGKEEHKNKEQTKDSSNSNSCNSTNEMLIKEKNNGDDYNYNYYDDEFLKKCLKIHKMRKSLKNAKLKIKNYYMTPSNKFISY